MIPNMPGIPYIPLLREEEGGERECTAEERKAEEKGRPRYRRLCVSGAIGEHLAPSFWPVSSVPQCLLLQNGDDISTCIQPPVPLWVLSCVSSCFFIYFFLFWPHPMACRILVPQPGIEPTPPSVEACNLNHWATQEIPVSSCFYH